MRTWSILFMLAIVALSGCADSGEESPDAANDPTSDEADGGGNETTEDTGDDASDAATGGNNTAPEASLEASALNGTAPLNVTLTVDGSDADGDNLTWSLSQGDNETGSGDALPATVNVTLGEGNHTFILTISDGDATATANLTITVEAGEAPDLGPCGGEPEPCIVAEHPWVTVWSDGRCDATNEVLPVEDNPGGYVHDRRGPGGEPLIHFGGILASGGGGIWLFEESNGIPGLQLTQELSALDEADGLAKEFDCQNGDTIIF